MRIHSSEESLAPPDDATFAAILDKHPPLHPNSAIPPLQEDLLPHPISVTAKDVVKVIRSFPNGSAGGPDGLKPQHLKDMICPSVNTSGFLPALSRFVQLVFFGANLTALQKQSGGVRSIAVGCTLQCLMAKVIGGELMDEMGDLLAPWQLEGVKGGGQRLQYMLQGSIYLQSLDTLALRKLDFRNAFNSILRDWVLKVLELAPRLFRFVHSAYSSPSTLFWEDKTIQSAEGVQQGDPLGPLLFCLTIQQLKPQLTSEFQVFYLDDSPLVGSIEDLKHDLQVVKKVGQEIGL